MSNEEKIRVLVVDDEESLLAVLSQVLSKSGYEVTAAASGEEAWEIFKTDPFPLVITDIVMKEMTGIELLKKIKEMCPDTQVIIITSYASLDTAVNALRSGAYDYLFKPFEDLDMISTVTGRAVEKMKLISENRQLIEKLNRKGDELEHRVEERTSELDLTNEQLKSEIEEHKRTAEELKQAKEAADSANRAKSEFLANMSHEFRTPLNHIIGFTELVADRKFGELNTEQENYLKNALVSSRHLLAMVNDILDLSKVETGKIALEPSEVDMKVLFQNCLSMFKEKAKNHNIVLSSDMQGAPDTIIADERKMRQIIYNLLSNAVKFTPDNGRVNLNARKIACKIRPGLRQADPQYLHIVEKFENHGTDSINDHEDCLEVGITDSGIGIKGEDLKRVFNRFEQIDGSINRKYAGTGLGLSLTKALVEIHGGKIWAESKGKDQGSTFRFIIPI
jgi:signal transduction histidine kinase